MFRSTSSNDADNMERNLAMLATQFVKTSQEPEQEPSLGHLMINTSGVRMDGSTETLDTLPMPPAMAILNDSRNTVKLARELLHKQDQLQLKELMKKNMFRSSVNEGDSGSGLTMRQPQVVSLEHGLDISFSPPHETEPPEYTSNNINYNNLLNLNEEVLEDNLPISWPKVVSLEPGLEVTPPHESVQHVDGFGNFQFTHLNNINHQMLEDNVCQDEGTQSEPPCSNYSSLANLFLNTDQVTELSFTASGEVEHVAEVFLPVSTPETPVVETRKKRGRNKRKERVEAIKAEKATKKVKYDEAITAFKSGAFKSYKKCAEYYGINNSVLRKYILSGTSYVGKGMVNQVLTNEEQKDIRDHLIYMSEIGFGYTIYDLKLDLQQLMTDIVRYVLTFPHW